MIKIIHLLNKRMGDFLLGTVAVQIMKLNLVQAEFIIIRYRKVLNFEGKNITIIFHWTTF